MFDGKTIIITGGSSGIGKVLAERLVKRGANLVLIARDRTKLESVQSELREIASDSQKVEVFSCDVSDAEAVQRTIEAIVKALGLPDILINSAGILEENHFEHQSIEMYRQIMDVNFFGTLHCIKACLPYFKQKGEGRIVNICSLAGLFGVIGYGAYCSSKHAMKGLTSTLRSELKPLNIKVQIVYPPEFDSPMVDELNKYRSSENRKMVHTIPVLGIKPVADAIMKCMENDSYEAIPGFTARMAARMDRWFPGLSRYVVDSRLKKIYGRGGKK